MKDISHSIEECLEVKRKLQDVIDDGNILAYRVSEGTHKPGQDDGRPTSRK